MSCPAEDEELRLRALSLSSGDVLDDAQVSPPRFDGRVIEATLLDAVGPTTGFAALVQTSTDAGGAAFLQLGLGSDPSLTCALPEGSDVAGAAFGGGYLWAYLRRDGGFVLESYPLTGLALAADAWPVADGIAGQRRAR
jgi:hypothetical protein